MMTFSLLVSAVGVGGSVSSGRIKLNENTLAALIRRGAGDAGGNSKSA